MKSISVSEDILLVPVKPEDCSFLKELMGKIYSLAYRDFWKDNGEWYVDLIYNESNIRKELTRKRSHYFFVKYLDQYVGILKYDFPFSPREIEIPEAMKLHRLYLSPKVQGLGIAATLMKHLETVALENDLDWIWLEAMDGKIQAKRFYQKHGYQLAFTYQLEFDLLHQEYRTIHIMKKSIC